MLQSSTASYHLLDKENKHRAPTPKWAKNQPRKTGQILVLTLANNQDNDFQNMTNGWKYMTKSSI